MGILSFSSYPFLCKCSGMREEGGGCIDDDTSKQRIIILQTNSWIIYSVVYIHMGVLREREREI